MSYALKSCLSFAAVGSWGVHVPRHEGTRRTAQPGGTWEFVTGWKRPQSEPGDWMPNYTEPSVSATFKSRAARHDGIAFISPTYHGNIGDAAQLQDSWTKFAHEADLVLNVVDPDCKEDPRLKSVIVLPPELLMHCIRVPPFHKKPMKCNGYHKANIKHIYGLMYMARQMQEQNRTVWPEWWVIKDDDTYVNVHNLRAVLATYDASAPIMVASKNGAEAFFGGSGVAVSWALAERMGLQHGRPWLNGMINHINSSTRAVIVNYDWWMAKDIRQHFVKDAKLINNWHFQHFLSACGNVLSPKWPASPKKAPNCSAIPDVCDCARSDAIAMWHLTFKVKGRLQERLGILDKYEEDTREGRQPR